jgi:hypothetical protein
MSFAGKWKKLKVIVSSKVSQVQKDKGHMFSLICRKQIQKINIYPNTNMIIYMYIENIFAIVGLFEGTRGRKERKREC